VGAGCGLEIVAITGDKVRAVAGDDDVYHAGDVWDYQTDLKDWWLVKPSDPTGTPKMKLTSLAGGAYQIDIQCWAGSGIYRSEFWNEYTLVLTVTPDGAITMALSETLTIETAPAGLVETDWRTWGAQIGWGSGVPGATLHNHPYGVMTGGLYDFLKAKMDVVAPGGGINGICLLPSSSSGTPSHQEPRQGKAIVKVPLANVYAAPGIAATNPPIAQKAAGTEVTLTDETEAT
jgi:hypothetical protein